MYRQGVTSNNWMEKVAIQWDGVWE